LKSAARGGVAPPVEKGSAQLRTGSEARGVYAAMKISTEVWRRVLTGEWSMRAAC
jgi:hypothetical protein